MRVKIRRVFLTNTNTLNFFWVTPLTRKHIFSHQLLVLTKSWKTGTKVALDKFTVL